VYTEAAPLEETHKSLVVDMAQGKIRLVALDGSKIVGWYQIKSGNSEGYTLVGRLQMGVQNEYRGQGIGTALLGQALEEARCRGLERVELGVYVSNLTAIHLHEKYKFEIEGLKKRARKIDGSYDDIIEVAPYFNV
jgi:ribosomal protein S18 acetylase RimI-like enzyme